MKRRPAPPLVGAVAGAVLLSAALAAVRLARPRVTESPARAAARAYYLRALSAADSLQLNSAHRWLLRSLQADPGYLPAVQFPWTDPILLPADLARDFQRLSGRIADASVAACIRARFQTISGERAGPAPDDACALFVNARAHLPPGKGPVDLLRELVRRYPESRDLRLAYRSYLIQAHRWSELLAEIREARRLPVGRFVEGASTQQEAVALLATGRPREAERVLAAAALAARGWSPGSRRQYFEAVTGRASLLHVAGVVDPAAVRLAAELVSAARDSQDAVLRGGDDTARRWGALDGVHDRVDTGELERAVRHADTALVQRQPSDPPEFEAAVRLYRARALTKLGRPREAEPDLLRARALLAASPWPYLAMETEHNLFHLYEGLGRDADARRAGWSFIASTRPRGRQATQMIALRDLALFLQQRGEIAAARPLFQGMVALVDSMGSLDYYAGEYFELIGDLDRAEAHYRRGTDDQQEDEGRAYAGMVRVARARGDVALAERYAREFDRGTGRKYPEGGRLLPAVLAAEGRLAEAGAELEAGRAEAAARGQRASWAALTLELAELKVRQGQPASAAALADSAGAAAEQVALPAVAAAARSLAALARLRAGVDPDEQIRRLHRAAALPAGTPLERLDRYRRLGDGLTLAQDLEGALRAYARAAAIVDSLAPSVVDPIDRAQFRERQLAITSAALRAILARRDEARAPALWAAWSARRKARVLLEAGLPKLRGAPPPRVDLPRLVRRLGRDAAILDYAVLDDAVGVLVVTGAGARLLRLEVTPAQLAAGVRRLRAPLSARVGSSLDTARARYPLDVAARLYDALVRPAEALLGRRPDLTIVADGPLHLVPFAALVRQGASPGSSAGARFLLDDRTVTSAPSLALAAPPGAARRVSGPVVALIDPLLPGARAEQHALSAALDRRPLRFLAGSAARPESLQVLARRAAVLHLSLHANANAQQPGYASLVLPGSGALLYAYELSGLRLRGGLVVLSGCETADGSLLEGEGVLSLGRSFLAAGAEAVVATAWPVGSSAAELMGAFYRGLAAGQAPAVALRAAQLQLRRDPRRDPVAWAPFVFISGAR